MSFGRCVDFSPEEQVCAVMVPRATYIRAGVRPHRYPRVMPTLEDIREIVRGLEGAEERSMTGGAAWFVRNKQFAWECHPWPSIPEDMRDIIGRELVVGVKIGDPIEARALREMDPATFLRETTSWGEPKVAFRMARVDPDHLRELIIEAWRIQAPRYLRAAFDAEFDRELSGSSNHSERP